MARYDPEYRRLYLRQRVAEDDRFFLKRQSIKPDVASEESIVRDVKLIWQQFNERMQHDQYRVL